MRGELAKLADDIDAVLARIALRLTSPEAAAFGRTSGTLRRLDREDHPHEGSAPKREET